MAKVITYGGDTKIGAYKFADRKKVCLCIERGNEITIYGTFNSEYCANNFMDELGKFIGAKFDCPRTLFRSCGAKIAFWSGT